MKNIILVVIACFTMSITAQEKMTKKKTLKTEQAENSEIKSSEAMINNRVDRLALKLDLTSSQKEKLRDIYKSHSKKRELKQNKADLASKKRISKETAIKQRIEKREVYQTEINSKIKDILTPEQYAKYESIITKKKQRVRQKTKLKEN